MGLHHRNLSHSEFTGDHLKGGPSYVGMVQPSGKAPYCALALVGLAVALLVFFAH